MRTEKSVESDVAIAALRLLPPKVRVSILEDAEFRQKFSLGVDSIVRFERTGAAFVRSALFRVVRQVLAGSPGLEIQSKDGAVWRVTYDAARGITIGRDGTVVYLPELACISSDVNARIDWFDQHTTKFRVADSRIRRWREILGERALEDEEIERLLDEFRLTPSHSAAAIQERLHRRNFSAADLVPSDLRYFDRLTGAPSDKTNMREFVSGVLVPHVHALVERNHYEGLKEALLLSSHSMISDAIDLRMLPREEVLRVFEWVTDQGDRISQVGAIECGLRYLDSFPDIEPNLAAMTRAIAADDPDDSGGRLTLVSGLVALVEGEIARRGIMRRRPPFWRRLGAIAHAALIEREVLAARLESASVADWALTSGGALYYMQTLVDLRQEPRWFPDFISAQHLKAEFVSRIAGAAERHRAHIAPGELSAFLWGPGPTTIQSQRTFPSSFLPGPLEGGVEAVAEMPAELEADVKSRLEAEELSPESFYGLVNSSLIFRVGSQLSELAAQGLRRVGYQLRKMQAGDDSFSLLHSLAMVSAVTRSKTLADEVRVLSRGVRRRAGSTLSPEAVARIALVAAAAHDNSAAWSSFVGDWFTELSFADMSREQAIALQGDLHRLLHIEPLLWETCGRAEAALSAFIESFPEEPAQSNGTTE